MDDNHNPPARYKPFGDRLHEAMRMRDLSASDVARALRVTPQAVGKYVRGESLPGADRLIELASLVGVPVKELAVYDSGAIIRRPRSPAALRAMSPEERQTPAPISPRRLERHVAASIVDSIDYRLRTICETRPDLDVLLSAPVAGPLFRYRPDVMVAGAAPVLGIEVKAGLFTGDHVAARAAGIAYNWREATHGAPLFMVYIIDPAERSPYTGEVESLPRADRIPRAIAMLAPLVRAKLLAGFYFESAPEVDDLIPDANRLPALYSTLGGLLGNAPPM